MKKLLLAFTLVSLSLTTAYAHEDNVKQFQDITKPIIVKSDVSTFQIKLDANKTTGYSWMLVPDKTSKWIVAEKEQYIAPKNTKLVGAPGQDIWTFAVSREAFDVPSELHATLVYARPWDMQGGKTVELKIVTQAEEDS